MYRELPKVTTLVTFGISSLWGSFLVGRAWGDRLFQGHKVAVTEIFLMKYKMAIYKQIYKQILSSFQFHVTIMGWPLHVYNVLSVVGTSCASFPEFFSEPFNHLPFLQWCHRKKYSSSLGSLHPHTLRRALLLWLHCHMGDQPIFQFFFKLKRFRCYLSPCWNAKKSLFSCSLDYWLKN